MRVSGEIAEGGNVRDDERRAARHRLEQRHPERGPPGRTEVDVGAAIVAGPAAVGVTREVHAWSEPSPPGGALHARAPRTVADDRQMRGGMTLEDARHRREHRAEVIARLDPSQPQQSRPWGPFGQAGAEEPRVDPVRDDFPRRREVASHRLLSGAADRDRGCMAIEQPLERTAQETKADRAGEPGVKRGDDGNARSHRGARCDDAERRIQPAMHMHDVEPLLAKQRLEPRCEPPAHGNPCDSAIRVDHQARTYTAHIRRINGAVHAHMRRHDDRMMPQRLQFPCEIVHVLRYAAELRIVVLRDERDAQRRHRGETRSASRSTADTTAAGRSSWR